MKKFVGVVLTTTLVLTACSSNPPDRPAEVVGPQWQVTDFYRQPGEISALPPGDRGALTMSFGTHSTTGTTGCSQFQASTALSDDELTITDVEYSQPVEQCNHDLHEQFVAFFATGASFTVSRPGPTELLLKKHTDDFDPPSLRMATVS